MPIAEEMARRKIQKEIGSLKKAIKEAEKLSGGEHAERIKGFILLLTGASASVKTVTGACSRSDLETSASRVGKRFDESLDLLSIQIMGVVQDLLIHLNFLAPELSASATSTELGCSTKVAYGGSYQIPLFPPDEMIRAFSGR